jgi:hypothetical protein
VRVYFGWGGARCPEEPTWTVIGGGEIDGLFGWDLAGGVDIDGDGIPDMAVSALGRVGNVANIGGAWVVSGSWMASLPRSAVTPGRLAAEAITTVDPGVEGARRISGDAVGQQFGSAVALLHGAESGGRLALGAALSGLSGTSLSGGVRVHAVDGEGLRREALAEFGGEAGRPEGRLGDRLAAGRLGARAVLAVGGYDANGAGLDLGAVYVLILD